MLNIDPEVSKVSYYAMMAAQDHRNIKDCHRNVAVFL